MNFGYIESLRPKQWIKNLFVFVGILFSGKFLDWKLVVSGFTLFVAFTLASGSVYVFNDIRDVNEDKNHPEKKNRPIASGKVTKNQASSLAIAAALLSVCLAWIVSLPSVIVILVYLAMNLAYTLKLKRIPVLDVFVISIGFVLRVFAGTYGLSIPPSNWIILCTFMLTLFLGFSKRKAELARAEDGNESRSVLGLYTKPFIDHALTVTAGTTIMSYALYTMSPETAARHGTNSLLLTVIPVTYAIFRYFYLVDTGLTKDDAANTLIRDRSLQIAIITWLGLFFGIQYFSLS